MCGATILGVQDDGPLDRIEHTGYWWEPRQPDLKWPGTLRFDRSDGAVLTILTESQKPTFFHDDRDYPVLWGKTASDKPITLLRCYDRHVDGSLKLKRREVYANAVIVGFHAEGPDSLVSSALLAYRHVNAWWNQTGFQHDDQVRPPDVSVRYVHSAPVVLYEAADFKVSIVPSGLPEQQRHAVSVTERVYLKIQASDTLPLREVERIAHACQDLFSIACLTYCNQEQFHLVSAAEASRDRHRATLHAVPIYTAAEGRSHLHRDDLLFEFADVRDRLQESFGSWLASEKSLRPVRALYFSGVYGEGYLEGKLLAMAQAVEGFHRRFYPGLYIEQSDYDTLIAPPLRAAIPNTVGTFHRDSLEKRIQYGNEYSLRKRLTMIVKEHREALSQLVSNPLSFVGRIADLRNTLSHQPPSDGDAPDDYADELLRCNLMLRRILELSFLKVMGFSNADITRLVGRCREYGRWSERFLRPPAADATPD